MGWLNKPGFTVEEAQAKGQDLYELLFSDWGLGDFTMDGTNFVWPPNNTAPLKTTLAGIAIGPKSTVDRAYISYDLQKNASPAEFVSGVTNRIREVSVGAPLIFSQAAGVQKGSLSADPLNNMFNGWLTVSPWDQNPQDVIAGNTEAYPPIVRSTVMKGDYFDANNVHRQFPNGGLSGGAAGQAGVVGPLLHLLLYLKTAPSIQYPLKRAPLKAGRKVGPGGVLFPANTENLVAAVAVHGRNAVHVFMQADQLSDFRVGALRVPGYNAIPGYAVGAGQVNESPVDSVLAVAANTPAVLTPCIQTGFYADYIMLYITPKVDNPNVIWTVSAYD